MVQDGKLKEKLIVLRGNFKNMVGEESRGGNLGYLVEKRDLWIKRGRKGSSRNLIRLIVHS